MNGVRRKNQIRRLGNLWSYGGPRAHHDNADRRLCSVSSTRVVLWTTFPWMRIVLSQVLEYMLLTVKRPFFRGISNSRCVVGIELVGRSNGFRFRFRCHDVPVPTESRHTTLQPVTAPAFTGIKYFLTLPPSTTTLPTIFDGVCTHRPFSRSLCRCHLRSPQAGAD